jgi:hypothetical protein
MDHQPSQCLVAEGTQQVVKPVVRQLEGKDLVVDNIKQPAVSFTLLSDIRRPKSLVGNLSPYPDFAQARQRTSDCQGV